MKNLEVLQLADQLKANMTSLKTLSGIKFAYMMMKNIEIIDKEVKFVSELTEIKPDYIEYDKERVELCKKFATKDENGEPIILTNNNGSQSYDIDEESNEWIISYEGLNHKHRSAIENRDKQKEEYNNFLNEESTIEFYKIEESELPIEITLEQLMIIKVFIKNN